MLCFLLFLQCLQPAAQDTVTVVALPAVTVTASRSLTRLLEAPVQVTVFDATAIQASAAQTVSELLDRRSGLFIRQYGGGGLASMSLRGTTSSQTLVLLDGLRIASPQLGQLDMSLLPTLLLESVEVMSGAGSALYGTDALGGVVHLRTLRADKRRVFRAKGGYGSYGQRGGSVLASGQQGSFSGVLAAEIDQSRGDYPFLNKALFPPSEVPREGADRRRRSLFSLLAHETTKGKWQLATWYNDAERGLPTIGGTFPREERQWDKHLRLWGGGNHATRWGVLHLRGLAQSGTLRYVNPKLDLDNTGQTLIVSADAEIHATPSASWIFISGLAGGYGRARHPNLQDNASEWHGGAFVSATGMFGRLFVYPSLRVDIIRQTRENTLSSLNPRLGANLRLLTQPALHLKVSAGRFFRAPTFNDRFWQPGGNPDLRAEHGWSTDTGVRMEHRHGHAEVSVFHSRVNDQIQWIPTKNGYWAPENLQRVVARGIEASYQWQWQALRMLHLGGGLSFTHTDARDGSQPVRLLPRNQLKSHLSLHIGPIRLHTSARYTGKRFITSDASSSLDAHILFDGQLQWQLTVGRSAFAINVITENILDKRYEVLPSNPMPPRLLRVECSVTFH